MTIRAILTVILLLLPAMAQAHLVPKQHATMKIVDETASFVVAVPASELAGVDENGDGLLSKEEIQTHEKLIEQQFAYRFAVTNGGKAGTDAMLSVIPSETAVDYVVVLYAVRFDETPRNPVVSTDLFGTREGEGQMAVRATLDDTQEVAILTPKSHVHEFFKPTAARSEKSVGEETGKASARFEQWLFLLAAFPIGGVIFYIRRAKHSKTPARQFLAISE